MPFAAPTAPYSDDKERGWPPTDVEVISPSADSSYVAIYAHDGDVDFTDKSGKVHAIPKGYKLEITTTWGHQLIGDATPMNDSDRQPNSEFTDKWDMTPFKGRELQ